MAGGHTKYRHLSRHSAHRQALLRNLVTSLMSHQSITTTWPKAKEAQRMAEKLVTLAKRNTEASYNRARAILLPPFTTFPEKRIPALFAELRERYASRPGGYTRVLRTEPRNRNNDQAPTAILELVDGPRDMRFAMTARTVARERETEEGIRDVTLWNVKKVTQFRPNGQQELLNMANQMADDHGVGRKERREGKQKELKDEQEDAKEARAASETRRR